MHNLTHSIALLEELVGFPTISRTPNISLIQRVADLLRNAGARVQVLPGPDSDQTCNLWASVGPTTGPGVVLSGHCDVVPVAGQNWTSDPFKLERRDMRLYGRGTADMKGFVACAITAMIAAAGRDLQVPLHLALSCDEEIGCVGVRPMLEMLATREHPPILTIVGEPTGMTLATGHKGKLAARARVSGRAAHAALAPLGLNAIHLATDFVSLLRAAQARLAQGTADQRYGVPYSTIHAGVIAGGTALNIVPSTCTVDFEIRTIPEDDARAILAIITADSKAIVAPYRDAFPEAAIEIEALNAYPGLDTRHDEAIAFVAGLTGTNSGASCVSFGTEGGLFDERLNCPVVICGPGSMEQGHQPDEFVAIDQLAGCCAMLERLVDRLANGPSLLFKGGRCDG